MIVQTRMLALLAPLLVAPHTAWAVVQNVQYTATPMQVAGGIGQFPPASKLFDLSGQSSDNTASFYAVWDYQNFYFGIDVKDTALFCNSLSADSQVAWSNDAVELNFDLKKKKVLGPGDQDFRQWIFPTNFNNNVYDAYGTGDTADISFTGTASANITLSGTLNDSTTDTGYTAVIIIPWTDLALSPVNDLSFGFDGAINDRDSVTGVPTWADWANLQIFAQPDKWNELKIVGGPPKPTTDTGVSQLDGSTLDGWTPQLDGGGNPPTDTSPVQPRPKDKLSCDCAVGSRSGGDPLQVVLALVFLALLLRQRRASTRSRR